MRTVVAFSVALAMVAAVLSGSVRANPGDDSPMTQAPRTRPKEGPVYSRSAFDVTPLSEARVSELAKSLTPEEAHVILRQGTERPFCGTLLDNKKEGVYVCRLCGLPLFSSESKFNSGTGWPSFFAPYDVDHVAYIRDESHGMERVEIVCARCEGHLGHVFNDAPQTKTGLRYCLNSASLSFIEKGTEAPAASRPIETATACFAGGCFWGVEDRFQQVAGVIDAVSGFQGGWVKDPTYKQVCFEETGHAEAVRVVYDPKVVSYEELLAFFFRVHDPTQLNRQGPDVGVQYRSAIFAANAEQAKAAKEFVERLQQTPKFAQRRIVTQVVGPEAAGEFYPAEEYHQDYHAKHGGSCVIPSDE